MTNEEAIAELKTSYCTECSAAIENNTCYENECEIFLSIEALEKQIPKKPIKAKGENLDWLCPVCGEWVGWVDALTWEKEHHCECGQKIDWSEN